MKINSLKSLSEYKELNYKDYSLKLLLLVFGSVTFVIAVIDFLLKYYIDSAIDIFLSIVSFLLLFIYLRYNKFLLIATIFYWVVAVTAFVLVFLHKFDMTVVFLLLTPIIAFLILPIKEAVINIIIYEIFVILILYYGYIHYKDLRPHMFSVNGFMNFTSGTLYLIMFWIFYHKFVEKSMENLAKLNRQKSLLLNEIQHRVKNNFNMILSILKVQQSFDTIDSKEFVESFSKRVESIVIAQDLLYKSNELDEKISIKDYIEKLTFHILKLSSKKADVKLNIEPLNISIEHSIYIGIILNEMITNSIKYAFSNYGFINITFKQMDNKDYKLIYYDNSFLQKTNVKENSLGILIIKMAVKQLNGSLKIKHYRYEIDFSPES